MTVVRKRKKMNGEWWALVPINPEDELGKTEWISQEELKKRQTEEKGEEE